jgi:hypothetical protein
LLVSLVYVLTCRLLELVVLLGRGERSKKLEILVLRHEPSILRRQVAKPRFGDHDRLVLAALSRVLPRRSWGAFVERPETLLRWQRRMVARRWTYPQRRPGRPPIAPEVSEWILRLARENTRGYVRVVGELRRLGIVVSATLVRNVLARAATRSSRALSMPSSRARASGPSALQSSTQRERAHRALDRQRPPRMPRPAPDRRPPTARAHPAHLRPPLQPPSAAPRARPPVTHPSDPPAKRGDPAASAAAVQRRHLLGGLIHEYELPAAA